MPEPIRSFDRINIPAPCDADWDSMIGNDQVRFCDHCSLHVSDLSLSRHDALRFVERAQGRVCIRYIVRPDGQMVTRTMPEKFYRIGRRASRIVAGAFTATMAVTSAAAQPRSAGLVSHPTATIRHVAAKTAIDPALDEAPPSVSGTITTSDGAPISDVIVVLVDRDSGEQRHVTSSDNGEYVFPYVPSADYLLWARKRGFETGRTLVTVKADTVRENFILLEKSQQLMVMGGAMAMIERGSQDPLIHAVAEDDLAAVRLLAFATPDINAIKPYSGVPLLNQAVERGNREMVQILLRAGADVNARSGFGRTAIMSLSEKTSAEIVRDLIEAGAKLNFRDNDGESLLMIAAGLGRPAILKEVLKAGARIEGTNSSGQTALFSAARSHSVETVNLLIDAGVDITARDEDGQTALMAVLSTADLPTVKAFVKRGAEINVADDQGRTGLILAAMNENSQIVELLIPLSSNVDAADNHGSTALLVAAEAGPVKSALLLIYAGASLEKKDAQGLTPLLLAARGGSIEIVDALLSAGADLSARDEQGKTAIALAREDERDDMVSYLKNRGAPE